MPTRTPATVTTAAQLDGVTVSFQSDGKSNTVLNNVSLTINDGEFVALIGKSGCGKTTILNVLAGLVDFSAGRVQMLGGDPREARQRMGYMFARDALMPWRSALKNVEYPLELRKYPRRERASRAAEYLEMVHMGHAARRWPWQLSQGMRQRVALARTWVTDPEILLMDEPFAALDSQTRLSVQEELVRMWQSTRKAVVFVTHDLTEALMLAQRIVVLQDGVITADVRVPFEYPRTRETTTHSDFNELRRELMAYFD